MFNQNCVNVEEEAHFRALGSIQDQYNRKTWCLVKNEQGLKRHYKSWEYKENEFDQKLQEVKEVSKPFIGKFLNSTESYRVCKKECWCPNFNKKEIDGSLNTFHGFPFDGASPYKIAGPDDPNIDWTLVNRILYQLYHYIGSKNYPVPTERDFKGISSTEVMEEQYPLNEVAVILPDYFSSVAQNPEEKVGVMPFLFGEEGLGKTWILYIFMKAFGNEHSMSSKTQLDDIVGKFNSCIDDKLFAMIPEPEDGLKESEVRQIMSLVTDSSQTTGTKFVQVKGSKKNYTNLIACINKATTAFQTGTVSGRRWMILQWKGFALGNDKEHIDAMKKYQDPEMASEHLWQFSTLYYWLKTRVIKTEFADKPSPETMLENDQLKGGNVALFVDFLQTRMRLLAKDFIDTPASLSEKTPQQFENFWKMFAQANELDKLYRIEITRGSLGQLFEEWFAKENVYRKDLNCPKQGHLTQEFAKIFPFMNSWAFKQELPSKKVIYSFAFGKFAYRMLQRIRIRCKTQQNLCPG